MLGMRSSTVVAVCYKRRFGLLDESTRTRSIGGPRLRLRLAYRHDIFVSHHTAVTISKQAVSKWGVRLEMP